MAAERQEADMDADTDIDVDPPVTEDAGHGAATLADGRVVASRTVETWAGPITVLVSAPQAADRQAMESAAYAAGNEVADLAALATGELESDGDA